MRVGPRQPIVGPPRPPPRRFEIISPHAGGGALNSSVPTSKSLSKLLWINAGLDVLYVAAGAHIAVRKPNFGRRITADQAIGHGTAVVVQGAALLALDTTHARMIAG